MAALLTVLHAACTEEPDDGATARVVVPDPIGPELLHVTPACIGQGCDEMYMYRNGEDVQMLFFSTPYSEKPNPEFIDQQRGRLQPEISVMLDQLLATIDPSQTEIVNLEGICDGSSHAPYVELTFPGGQLNYRWRCPPAGAVEADELIYQIFHGLLYCGGELPLEYLAETEVSPECPEVEL